jgi:sarcosine oxidase
VTDPATRVGRRTLHRVRCIVVGAGAWGLPTATELARRGHDVTLLDRHGVGNLWSSSPGPTRLWRLTHPDAVRVRLAQRSIEAWERLEALTGRVVHLRRGLLWRDDESLPAVAAALAGEAVPYAAVEAADVGRFFPGLRPDGRDAVWQETAGPVLAAESLRAHGDLFADAGGRTEVGPLVRTVDTGPAGVRLGCEDGAAYDADVVVLAAGPGAGPLLAGLGVELPLYPHLEQVVHFGNVADPGAADGFPCLYDGPLGEAPGAYTMPTPGVGYKIGLDRPLRDLAEGDLDRSPDAALVAATTERVRRDLTAIDPTVVDAQVCCWTDSPDGRFVIDTLAEGRVVVACGDSGEGFKFSALMGLVLADLAEGQPPDPDVATFGLGRFAGGFPDRPHVLGR